MLSKDKDAYPTYIAAINSRQMLNKFTPGINLMASIMQFRAAKELRAVKRNIEQLNLQVKLWAKMDF